MSLSLPYTVSAQCFTTATVAKQWPSPTENHPEVQAQDAMTGKNKGLYARRDRHPVGQWDRNSVSYGTRVSSLKKKTRGFWKLGTLESHWDSLRAFCGSNDIYLKPKRGGTPKRTSPESCWGRMLRQREAGIPVHMKTKCRSYPVSRKSNKF